MARAIRSTLRRMIALLLVGLFVGYVWRVRHDIAAAFLRLNPGSLASLLALLLVQWGLRAWRDSRLFTASGNPVHASALFWLNNVQLCLNYLPFKSGTLASAEFLHQRFGIGVIDFLRVVTQQYLLGAFAAASLAAVAVWFVGPISGSAAALASVVFLSVAACSICLLLWRVPTSLIPEYLLGRFSLARGGLDLGRSGARSVTTILLLTFGLCFASAMRMKVVFGVVSQSMRLTDAVVVSAALLLSPLVAVTPAGLGVTETFVGLTSVLIGRSGEDGVVATTLDRAVALVLSLIIAVGLATFHLRKRVRS